MKQVNMGDQCINVDGDLNVELIVYECFLKKPKNNNVSVSPSELKLRICMMVYMLGFGVCFFAFWYPFWWQESEIYFFATNVSWAAAGACFALILVIWRNRKAVESMICMNINAMEQRRKEKV